MIRVMLGVLALATSLSADAVRVLQTNAAGDNIHVIDPATNHVVATIEDIEVPHGVVIAPDGTPHLRHQRIADDARRGGREDAQSLQANSIERAPQ